MFVHKEKISFNIFIFRGKKFSNNNTNKFKNKKKHLFERVWWWCDKQNGYFKEELDDSLKVYMFQMFFK